MDGESWDFAADSLGRNLCESLVVAAAGLHGRVEDGFIADVELYGGPDSDCLILYITVEEEKVIVRLYYIEDADFVPKGTLGDCLKKAESSHSEVCEAVYRALRALLIGHGLEYLSAEWQEFPVGAFIQLHRALGNEPVLTGDGFDSELRCLLSMLDA